MIVVRLMTMKMKVFVMLLKAYSWGVYGIYGCPVEIFKSF
jgi:hypothetical protein